MRNTDTELSLNSVVAEAADGHEALALVRRHAPDVLVLDLTKPLVDGLGVARALARHAPRLRVVVLTLHGERRDVAGAPDATPDPLTPREREVLQLVAEGNTTRSIAHTLGISYKTAETHRSHIMRKLDIHETAGLVRYAIRRGMLQA